MKIFSAQQIRQWDAYTILNEPVAPIDLMERAAKKCFEIISRRYKKEQFCIFCGPGNNGGDGLAIGRLLIESGRDVGIFLSSEKEGTGEYQANLKKIRKLTEPEIVKDVEGLSIKKNEIIIDALFGTGLNKIPDSFYKNLIGKINGFGVPIISIDVPSGMFTDRSSKESTVVKSNLILTFQRKKQAFFMPENSAFLQEVQVLDIGLSKEYEANEKTGFQTIDNEKARSIYHPRNPFSNKGDYGYACLIAGSRGMTGAAVLATKACLRSGAGKVSCHTCEACYAIIQATAPEAMCTTAGTDFVGNIPDTSPFNAIGIGPGLGKFLSHKKLIASLFSGFKKPVVADADALNIIAEQPELLAKIPSHSILTPHPKEFERLFGKTENNFEERDLAIQKAVRLNIYIILKGRYTCVATPEGNIFINETGNPGMATGGSGDVLTGILTGLLAQGYSPEEACLLGVYLHGLAGDKASKEISEESLIAGDLCRYLGKAFRQLAQE